MQNRFASLLIAALLPLLLFKWFVPSPAGQIDFWLMWVIAMVIVGLPLLFAEIGLSHRSQKIPLKGVQELTRQADSSIIWRSFVWLGLLLSLIVSALSIDAVSSSLFIALKELGIDLNVADFAIVVAMAVLAGILSLLGGINLVVACVLVALAFILTAVSNLQSLNFIMTDISLGEWARAVILTLISVGIGAGLYWYNNPQVAITQHANGVIKDNYKKVATKVALPIWFTQLIVGSVAIIFATQKVNALATIFYALGVLATAAYLMSYTSSQLATLFERFGIWIATFISMLTVVILVVILSPTILTIMLVVLSLISALVLAVFSGWQMKISHMRKSLNFSSEGVYNIWRVAIRILVPILIIVAAIGWFMP